jgi:succinoglycan biosynthesis transport protein ExoP
MTPNDPEARLVPLPVPVRPEGPAPPPALPLVPPGFVDTETGIDWPRILGAVVRFKWLILSVTLLGAVAGVVLTRFLKPVYLAQATIWIDEGDRRAADRGPSGPIRSGHLLDSEAWVDLLRSYVVLDQVVRDERLFLSVRHPTDTAALATFAVAQQYRPGAYRLTLDSVRQHYTLATTDGIELEHGAVGDSIGARLGFLWAPTQRGFGAKRDVEFTTTTVRDAARRLNEALDARAEPDGNFLRLELRGSDPARITAIVNAVTQRYITVAAELKREKVTELTKILDQQLQSARQNLQDAEAALESFGVRTITLPSDRAAPGAPSGPGAGENGDPARKTFFDVQLERDLVERERAALEQAIAQARDSGVSSTALEAIGAVQRNGELSEALKELTNKQADLRTLKYRYADAYPPVQRLTAEIVTLERQTIPRLAQALVAQLAARAAELGRRVDAGSRTLRAIPPRVLEEARLRRGVTLAENLYTTLQQRYEEARLAEASTIPDVRILDSAVVPQRPVKNTGPRVILVALLGSLGLGVVGAVLLDRADPRVRYPVQVSREMGLAILGALPHLKSRRNDGNDGGRPREDVAQLVEALRGVCLNLVHAYGAAGPMLVTITSPGPGDGKSFLAANLALTFAEGGHRTLLVDADIRRGLLHRSFTGRRRPGLSDCLRDEVTLEAIVQGTAYPSLTLIGCGTRVHNAPELLGSQAMAQLIHRVRPAHDVILIDSPPLAGGVDPFILGTLAGSLLLVLRTGHSHREVAAAKLEMLHRLPVRLLGAVLNDCPEAAYRYYSYYLPGYEAADEHATGQRSVIQS